MKTVYSYYLPEVRAIVDELAQDFPHGLLLENVHPGLDELHVPLFERFEAVHGESVRGWSSFAGRYPVAGASEALFHLLARHAATRPEVPLYALEGEYQGYDAYARALGLRVHEVSAASLTPPPASLTPAAAAASLTPPPASLTPGVFFLSNPSARDGNLLPDGLLDAILQRHEVVLDLSYLGMTRPLGIDLSHPSICAVVASLSKPYGLYYFRLGLCWTREPLASLYGNRWFKNAFSIVVGQAVLDRLDLDELRSRYRAAQSLAVARASEDLGVELVASDVWLLAHCAGPRLHPALEPFRRGPGARVCLTGYLMAAEAGDA
jgi:hypothetical protein